MIVNYNDSGVNKTLRLIEPDYEKAYLLTLDAYNLNLDEHRNMNLLMNLAFRYYQYYLDTIKRSGKNEKTNIMSEEIKTYLRQYITETEKVYRNKQEVQDDKEATKLLNLLQKKSPLLLQKESHISLQKSSSSLKPISEEGEGEGEGEEEKEEKEGPGWESSNWSLGGKSIKRKSIKRKSIKRRSIKRRSIKRKSKTYKKTRRSYRKTKSYYKK